MKKLVLLIILTFSFAINQIIAQQSMFVQDSLDVYVNREMKAWQVPGLAIAIVKDGKIVLSKGYGIKQIDKPNEAVNEFSQFQIASNSKAFTGTSIALLNNQKRVLLDEKVTTYLPYFKLYDSTSTLLCTVRDLLCHRIGLQTFQGDFLNWGSTLTRKQIIEHLALTKPVHPFRYKYGYCNAAFIAAGEIIKQATDTSWDDFIKYHFFEPLEMKNTSSTYQDLISNKNACMPHTLVDGKLVKLPYTNIDNMGPSASINSCARDMANWLLFQLDSGKFNGKQIMPFSVLAETRKSNMVTNDVNSKIFKSKHFSNYGLGWNSYDYEGKRVWEHSGGANGFVTKTEFIPELNLGVLVYTNTDANSLYDALVKQVIESYMNLPYRNLSQKYLQSFKQNAQEEQKLKDSLILITKSKTKPIIDFKNYEGVYKNSFYGKVTIKNEKGNLKLYFEHHPNNVGKLAYLSNHEFLCTYTDITCGVEVINFKVEDNKVKSVSVKVNDFIDYLRYDFEKE